MTAAAAAVPGATLDNFDESQGSAPGHDASVAVPEWIEGEVFLTGVHALMDCVVALRLVLR